MLKMTRKKVILTLLALVITFIAIIVLGTQWIASSKAMPIAKKAVAERLKLAPEKYESDVQLQWWRPWSFNEGNDDGVTRFVLCGNDLEAKKRCYGLRLEKRGGEWAVVDMVERI